MRDFDVVLTPEEYTILGDKRIQNLPLIKTSLYELAEHGWSLSIRVRPVYTYGHTRMHFHFFKRQESNLFLTLKFWKQGLHNINSALRCLIEEHPGDIVPQFSKPPSFWLQALPAEKEDELTFLKRVNDERAKTLPRVKRQIVVDDPIPVFDKTKVLVLDEYRIEPFPKMKVG